jgi:hypothetical protein
MKRVKSEIPSHVTASTLGACIGISERQIYRLVAAEHLPGASKAGHPFKSSIRAYAAFLKARADAPTVQSERRRKLAAEATLIELSLAKTRHELLDAKQVARTWQEIVLSIKRHLMTLSSKLAPRVPFMTSTEAARAEINREIDTILIELSAANNTAENDQTTKPPKTTDTPRT